MWPSSTAAVVWFLSAALRAARGTTTAARTTAHLGCGAQRRLARLAATMLRERAPLSLGSKRAGEELRQRCQVREGVGKKRSAPLVELRGQVEEARARVAQPLAQHPGRVGRRLRAAHLCQLEVLQQRAPVVTCGGRGARSTRGSGGGAQSAERRGGEVALRVRVPPCCMGPSPSPSRGATATGPSRWVHTTRPRPLSSRPAAHNLQRACRVSSSRGVDACACARRTLREGLAGAAEPLGPGAAVAEVGAVPDLRLDAVLQVGGGGATHHSSLRESKLGGAARLMTGRRWCQDGLAGCRRRPRGNDTQWQAERLGEKSGARACVTVSVPESYS